MGNDRVIDALPAVWLGRLRQLIGQLLGRGEASDGGRARYAAIARGLAAAIMSRGIGTLTALVSVPLTIGYLGPERYGVWMTINALIAWLMIADFGLGNGLVNAVAAAHGAGKIDVARRETANTLGLLVAISVLAIALTLPLAWALDLPSLLNIASPLARSEVGPAVAAMLLIFFVSFPFTLVRKVLEAIQEGDRAYAWAAAGSVVSLLGLLAVTQLRGGLVWLVIAVLGAQSAVAIASGIWLFGFHRPELRPRPGDIAAASLRQLLRSGGMFFVVQILALLNLSSDTFIIARMLGPSLVTPYSVTTQLFSYATLLQSLAFPLVWSSLAAAYSRGDWAWIRRTYLGFLGVSVGTTTLIAVPLALLAPAIIRLWAGAVAVPPVAFIGWMAGWSILQSLMNSCACVLNSQGRLRSLIIYASVTAIMNIGLSIWLAPIYGITGVVAASVIAYMIGTLLPVHVDLAVALRLFIPLGEGERWL